MSASYIACNSPFTGELAENQFAAANASAHKTVESNTLIDTPTT
jgi:hypothetical protein